MLRIDVSFFEETPGLSSQVNERREKGWWQSWLLQIFHKKNPKASWPNRQESHYEKETTHLCFSSCLVKGLENNSLQLRIWKFGLFCCKCFLWCLTRYAQSRHSHQKAPPRFNQANWVFLTVKICKFSITSCTTSVQARIRGASVWGLKVSWGGTLSMTSRKLLLDSLHDRLFKFTIIWASAYIQVWDNLLYATETSETLIQIASKVLLLQRFLCKYIEAMLVTVTYIGHRHLRNLDL